MEGQIAGWLIGAVLLIIPIWKILRKVGANPFLALIAAIPALGFVIVLFIIAYSRWPAVDGRPKPDSDSGA